MDSFTVKILNNFALKKLGQKYVITYPHNYEYLNWHFYLADRGHYGTASASKIDGALRSFCLFLVKWTFYDTENK